MVSSPRKGPQVSDGCTLSKQTNRAFRAMGSPATAAPSPGHCLSQMSSPPGTQPHCPQHPQGWTRGSSSLCPAPGTAGGSEHRPADGKHLPCLGQHLIACSWGMARDRGHGLPNPSFSRQPGVLCPEPWPRGYSRPDGVGEECSCTQEGGEAQQSDEYGAHA